MSIVRELHDQAMEYCDEAFAARYAGNTGLATRLFHKAYDHESRAAMLLLDDLESEPTRSVLFRSAATLAIDCGEFGAAIDLIAKGLAGNAPAEIVTELNNLLAQLRQKDET